MTENGTTTAVIVETHYYGIPSYRAHCQCGWKSWGCDRQEQAVAANKRHAEKEHA